MVGIYYKSDQVVAEDQELQDFVKDIYVYGMRGKKTSGTDRPSSPPGCLFCSFLTSDFPQAMLTHGIHLSTWCWAQSPHGSPAHQCLWGTSQGLSAAIETSGSETSGTLGQPFQCLDHAWALPSPCVGVLKAWARVGKRVLVGYQAIPSQPDSALGFPKSIKTREKLSEYLTVVIFTASAQHAAVNFGQVGKGRMSPLGRKLPESP